MDRLEKIHSLKVIKEALNNPHSIIYIEKLKNKDVYLTSNRLEISEQIRELFFKDAIMFKNVSTRYPTEDWVKIPYHQ